MFGLLQPSVRAIRILHAIRIAECTADGRTNRESDGRTNRPSDRPADRETDRRANNIGTHRGTNNDADCVCRRLPRRHCERSLRSSHRSQR